jgi:hypothetical protein
MKFFVPGSKDDIGAESVYEAFAKFIDAPITKKRIWKLKWCHNGNNMSCEVGKRIMGDSRFVDSPVLAIFDCGNLYKICTPNRGGIRGEPILAGNNFDTSPTYFDEE